MPFHMLEGLVGVCNHPQDLRMHLGDGLALPAHGDMLDHIQPTEPLIHVINFGLDIFQRYRVDLPIYVTIVSESFEFRDLGRDLLSIIPHILQETEGILRVVGGKCWCVAGS
jgi:hypothetical protein